MDKVSHRAALRMSHRLTFHLKVSSKTQLCPLTMAVTSPAPQGISSGSYHLGSYVTSQSCSP